MKPHDRISLHRLPASLNARAIVVILAACALAAPLIAADGKQDKKRTAVTGKAYLLDCPTEDSVGKLPPQGLYWKTLHKMLDDKAAELIKITDVAKLDHCRFLNDGNPGYWNSAQWSNIERGKDRRFTVDPGSRVSVRGVHRSSCIAPSGMHERRC